MSDAQGGAPALAEWLGTDPPGWPAIDTLDDGAPLVACYYLARVQERRTRNDDPYLRLELHDRHGSVDGRVWDDTDRVTERVEEGSFVGVRGRVQLYRGDRQLKIEKIARVRVRDEEKGLFMPRAPRDQEAMERELHALLDSIDDAGLRSLLERLLGGESLIGRQFRYAPAAKRNHHAYVGGLLEHTLSVTGLCDRFARHYQPLVDRDLLIAGALVHDIGKIRELATEAGFPYTDEGRLLGHILLGLTLVEDEAREVPELTPRRRTLLLHLIASHQGRYEWQSPREPRTLEGLLLHYADDVDAKMHQAAARVHEVEEGWTAYDRSFGREFLRHELGVDRPGAGIDAGSGGAAATDPGTGAEPEDGDRAAADRASRPAGGADAPDGDASAAPPDDTLNLFPE